MGERSASMSVRRFVLLATLALSVGTALAVAIAFVRPAASGPRIVEVALADVPALEPLFVRPFNMGVSVTGLYGVWLVRVPEAADGVLVLFSRGTWGPKPCHVDILAPAERATRGAWFFDGSGRCRGVTYARDGSALFSPRGLDRFDLEVVNGMVRIDVSRLRLGECGAQFHFPAGCPYSTPAQPKFERIHWPEA